MGKTQTQSPRQPDTGYNDSWSREETDIEEGSDQDAGTTLNIRMTMRHKIEDLLDSRRLNRQIGDYESFAFDDEKPHRVH